jgi:hypothetical protein
VNTVHKLLIAGWIAAGIVLAYTIVSDAKAAEDETFVVVWFQYDLGCTETVLNANGVTGWCYVPKEVYETQYAGEVACITDANKRMLGVRKSMPTEKQHAGFPVCLPIALAYRVVSDINRWRRDSSF